MRVFIALVLFVLCASSAFATPQLVAESLHFDFGELRQGEKVDRVFRFRNAGDEILEVGKVRTSCGCTAALLSATRIAPGDMGELRTTFDSTRFKGKIHKTITMETNAPKTKQISFSLTGDVKAEVVMQPERVNWGRVKPETPLNSTVLVTNQGKTTINLKTPSVSSPGVSAKLSDQLLSPGKQVELRITAKFPEGKKRLGGYVIIATDYPKVPQIRIPVSARLAQ